MRMNVDERVFRARYLGLRHNEHSFRLVLFNGGSGGGLLANTRANGRAASFLMLNVSITADFGWRSMRRCPRP